MLAESALTEGKEAPGARRRPPTYDLYQKQECMEPHLRFPHSDTSISHRMFFIQKHVTYFGILLERYSQETSVMDFLKVFLSSGKEK